jgi:hypothetical protein
MPISWNADGSRCPSTISTSLPAFLVERQNTNFGSSRSHPCGAYSPPTSNTGDSFPVTFFDVVGEPTNSRACEQSQALFVFVLLSHPLHHCLVAILWPPLRILNNGIS